LLHTVAKLHYLNELSQVRIAEQLGLSTATISRLLQRARAEGIVRIEIREIFDPDELGEQLADRLGLEQVVVVDAPAAGMLSALAPPLSRMLTEAGLGREAVLLLGWGRTVWAVIEAGLPSLPGVVVVPSTGGMQQKAHIYHSNEFARRAADLTGGLPQLIHAPYVPAPEVFEAFLAEQSVRDAMSLWNRIDVAVLGIGMPPKAEHLDVGDERHDPLLDEAVGDVVRHYFDEHGDIINWRGEGHMIGVTVDQLRAARISIGLAAGENKVRSIIGAARTGMITRLITDTRTAEGILDSLAEHS
jgi:DNA-binding transcriptional regulator LsrR (DeoR family)